jgi:catechol 2,3-dioxygenase-like lactoylglutathione lyase family enzyme
MSGILQSVGTVRIFVDDVERARHFYRDILDLRETSTTPDWAVFDLGSSNIVVEKVAADDPEHDLVGRFLAVSFKVDDIQATYQKLLAKGVVFSDPPERQVWGGTLAFARDPDGNVLTLVG